MSDPKPIVSISARVVACLWLALLMVFWWVEGGFRPWPRAAEGIDTGQWWSGKSIRAVESDFENQLTALEKVRPYYNWATFWAFGQSDGSVIRGKNGFMFYRSMLSEVQDEEDRFENFLALFRQLKLAYQKAGCDIYWLPIPEKAMVYPQNLYGAKEIVTHRKAKLEALVGDMKKLQFKVLDLPNAFFENTDSGELLFLPDDTHWTEKGKQLAVDLAVKALAGEKALTGHATRIETEVTRRHSDLPRLVNFPTSLRRRFHVHEVVKTRIKGSGPADFILFGTSFSSGFDLAGAIGAKLNAIPEDLAMNSITVPDLLMSAMARLEMPEPIKPGTPVIFEFPYRLILRTDGLREIKQQYQWLQSPAFKPAKITLDPSRLHYRNLRLDKVWTSTSEDPQLFIPLHQYTNLEDANFVAFRIKFSQRLKRNSKCAIFYDMGDGYKKAQSLPLTLNVTPSWQTWLLPIRYKHRLPEAIRIDPVDRKTYFKLGPITIH